MRINEIFYSLQGEGFYTGTPALFIRFAGCNLQCPFCDTSHQSFTERSEDEVVEAARHCIATHVILTGGEPSLQVTESLVCKLHEVGKYVAIETNGTHPLPDNIDWITLSPKSPFVKQHTAKVVLPSCDELKLVYDGLINPEEWIHPARRLFLQPCDCPNKEQSNHVLKLTIDYCLAHPQWQLSLQMHKLVGIQ